MFFEFMIKIAVIDTQRKGLKSADFWERNFHCEYYAYASDVKFCNTL